MNWTKEQKAIIESSGNIRINAIAGSGKTSTIIEYARTRSNAPKILYLAFNRSVKLEAAKRFTELGLSNVQVETAHSLAFKNIVLGGGYTLKSNGYKAHEIADLLHLKGNEEPHTEYIIANHVLGFMSYFCNSAAQKVQELNYRDVLTDTKVKSFVNHFYSYIEGQTRVLLAKMNSGDLEITHDFYLKKYQLSKPSLSFEYILFDEAQDASSAMLDVVMKQKATKVIVGDTHQQIYGWRYAVNSLEKADYKTYALSSSFRFNQNIADLAMQTLGMKKLLDLESNFKFKGLGSTKSNVVKAVIGRTNLGLLIKAIEYITGDQKIRSLYFEGNFSSYTYADEGASLYDVLNLYLGKKRGIRDKLLKQMNKIKDLENYVEKTGDMQLGMMVDIVKEYGDDIPNLLKRVKELHVPNDEKYKAEIIFSTVHRCKGMEYDSIELVNDFITEQKIESLKMDKDKTKFDVPKLTEEINLLYVGLTRTKHFLSIPEQLVPTDYKGSKQIEVIKATSDKKTVSLKEAKRVLLRAKSDLNDTYMHRIKKTHKGAYQKWSKELDSELEEQFANGVHPKEMARHFGRTLGSISSRIKRLRLYEKYFE